MTAPRSKTTRAQLEAAVAKGHLDGRTRTGRKAGPRPCPTCRAQTLVGDDDHLCALTARVDPEPVLLAAYAQGLAQGRRAYLRRGPATAPQLTHLDRWRTVGHVPPADHYPPNPEWVILLEHSCNAIARANRNRRKVPK